MYEEISFNKTPFYIYGFEIDVPVEAVFVKEHKMWHDHSTTLYNVIVVLEDQTYIQSDLFDNKFAANEERRTILNKIYEA